jgi:DNA ligase-1
MDLENGQVYEMQGSGKNPYKIKNVGGVYSCSCPAWLNQSAPSNARTCKHIRKLRGDAAEEARLAGAGDLKPLKPAGAEDKKELPLLKGEPWDFEQDLTGWWMSEKLDGVRAYWDGKQFLSRGYNIYHAPEWFTSGLPNHPLDGELWIGRKQFQEASDCAKCQGMPERWRPMKYLVFDAPDAPGRFEERMKFLADAIPSWRSPVVQLVEHAVCTGNDHIHEELERIVTLGGEGLMLRKPGSLYERTRSSSILKVKRFLDMEVIVDDYEPGEGRHKGRVGALWVKLSTGVLCKVGTGLKDRDRDNPPAKGSIITVKYQELTPDGALRFPVYVGPRPDGDPTQAPLTRKKTAKAVTVAVAADLPSALLGPVVAAVEVPKAAPATPRAAKPEPVPIPVPVPTPVSAGGPAMTTKRYFEFAEGSSSKFWEVWVEGNEVVTQWGKIGTEGRETRKEFPDAEKTKKEYDKLVAEKTKKGYAEKPRP